MTEGPLRIGLWVRLRVEVRVRLTVRGKSPVRARVVVRCICRGVWYCRVLLGLGSWLGVYVGGVWYCRVLLGLGSWLGVGILEPGIGQSLTL